MKDNIVKPARLLLLLSLLLLPALPVSAFIVSTDGMQQPVTPYDEWMQKARDAQAGSATKDTVPATEQEQQAAARQAGEYFRKAARAASNDTKKFQALLQAGKAFLAGLDYENAAAAYTEATSLVKLAGEQRAIAQLEAAKVLHLQALARSKEHPDLESARAAYAAVLQIPQIVAWQRAGAHLGLAQIFAAQQKYLDAALEYEQAGAPDSPDAAAALNFARLQLEQAPPSVQAQAVIERVYPRLLAAKIYDATIEGRRERTGAERAAVLAQWGDAMARQGLPARALELWSDAVAIPDAAPDLVLSLTTRIAAEQTRQGQYAEALQSWERITSLPGYDFARRSERAYGRALVFRTQGNEVAVRDELRRLLQDAEITPDAKANVLFNAGMSFKQERSTSPLGDMTRESLIAQDKKIAQLFDAAFNVPGASTNLRLKALLERAQLEVEALRFEAARALLFDAYKNWKATEPRSILKALIVADAKLYRIQKKYSEAVSTLKNTAQHDESGTPVIDQDVQQLGFEILREVYGTRNWDAARQVLSTLTSWGMAREESLLYQAEIEISAGKPDVARAMLQEVEALSLTPQQKQRLEILKQQLLNPAS